MRDRGDINVRELLAMGENVTRTLVHDTIDAISTTAVERSSKWHDTDEAIAHLQRIRDAVNNGEELVWAVVDFHLGQLPRPDSRTVKIQISDEDYAALEEQGRALGVTGDGFAQLLAEQSAKNHRGRSGAVEIRDTLRRCLIVAGHPQQADQFIMRNAQEFTGWQIVTFIAGRQNVEVLRGQHYELSVILTDTLTEKERLAISTATRAGKTPTIATANSGPEDRFSPDDAIAQQARINAEEGA